jgi:predicted ribosomally synthesized peptide with SipW-like signal peptide
VTFRPRRIDLVSKKLLLSILSLSVAIGLVGAGTYAMWTDSAVSSGNKFASGDLKLKVNGGDDPGTVFDIGNMKPGDEQVISTTVKNAGTVDGQLTFHGAFTDDRDYGLSCVLMVTSVKYGGTELLTGAPVSLRSIDGRTFGPDSLTAGTTKDVEVTVKMPLEVTGHMDEITNGELTFSLTQVH